MKAFLYFMGIPSAGYQNSLRYFLNRLDKTVAFSTDFPASESDQDFIVYFGLESGVLDSACIGIVNPTGVSAFPFIILRDSLEKPSHGLELSYGLNGTHFQIKKGISDSGIDLTLGIVGRPLKMSISSTVPLEDLLSALLSFFLLVYGKKIFQPDFWQPYRYAQVRNFLQSML